ncbi:MAG: acylneuraminate cytidylyltransferase family protein [Lachnospiraceae bacterium]|nr:acylneuraminate cytidylyltransferase family protein [Lachnospiraceae bacterium]
MSAGRLGIVIARSGSKGLPDKNIKDLCGKPLMAYSILAAKDSGCFTKTMVSTDSRVYAGIAESYGAEVPFLRSDSTASDHADKWEVVREVLDRYAERGEHFDDVCVLQPTSPFRRPEDIQNAYRIFDEKSANAVVSVCACEHPPVWSGRLGADGNMDDFNRPEMFTPRQQLGEYYQLNGAIFIAQTKIVYAGTSIYESKCFAYIMEREQSIDIDSERDFRIAAIMMQDLC